MKNIKIKPLHIVFELCTAMPFLFTLFSFAPFSLANKAVIVLLIISYILANREMIKRHDNIRLVLFNTILIFYILRISFLNGIKAVFNLYFYSYLLLYCLGYIFSSENILFNYKEYIKKNEYRVRSYLSGILILLLYSILFQGGLKTDKFYGGIVLYGPFPIPHSLAYIMLVIYCLCGIFDNENGKSFYLFIKLISVVSIIMTAVRSAAIAVILLMLCDFFSMKKRSRKTIILLLTAIFLIIIGTQTNLISNNPLTEKTEFAATVGGSASSGRAWYRQAAMTGFFSDKSVVDKLFGVGIDGVISYIQRFLGISIQAHNDYINTLVGYGLLGFLILIVFQIKLGRICVSKWNKLFFELFLFILAYYNGFIFYIMLTASFPVLLLYFRYKNIGVQVIK